MVYVTLSNDYGTIEMDNDWRLKRWGILEITGLGYPNKTASTVTYAGQDGQSFTGEVMTARTITISANICNDGNLQNTISNACRILNHLVTLRIESGLMRRQISCRCNAFTCDPPNGAYQHIVLQLIADKPAFEDYDSTEINIFRRVDLISTPFILPMEFTHRYTDAHIYNSGDNRAEPIFYISNSPVDGIALLDDEIGILITNETTGQHIKLDTTTQDGEIITVDIPHRKITSSTRGNIINTMSLDTFLDDFWLDIGDNRIVVTNYNTTEQISVVCTYKNQYIEAVV